MRARAYMHTLYNIDSLVHDCSIFGALTMELLNHQYSTDIHFSDYLYNSICIYVCV